MCFLVALIVVRVVFGVERPLVLSEVDAKGDVLFSGVPLDAISRAVAASGLQLNA
jgi:hypothetical protein